jgi:hypothetical protein
MTTPNPITVSVATDQASYNVGEPITVTVTYTDSSTVTETLTVTATVSDSVGNTNTGTASVQVNSGTQVADTVAVTDSFNDVYAQSSSSAGSAVFTSTVGSPPATT